MQLKYADLVRDVMSFYKQDEMPESLKWMERLPPADYRHCVAELYFALGSALIREDHEILYERSEYWRKRAESFAVRR